MAVFLFVLKIIGILLLCIIGLLLLVVLAVLFVPIRYKVYAQKGKESKDIAVKACVSWLLSFFHISFFFNVEKADLKVKIFGIPIKKKSFINSKDDNKHSKPDNSKLHANKIKSSSDNTEENKSNNKKCSEKNDNPQIDNYSPGIDELYDANSGLYTIETAESLDETEDNGKESTDIVEIKSNDQITLFSDNDVTVGEPLNTPEIYSKEAVCDNGYEITAEPDITEEKTSIFEKISDFIKSIIDIIGKLKGIIIGLFTKTEETVKKITREYDFYSKFFNDEKNKLVFSKCIQTFKKLLNSIKPRTVKGYLNLGFEDPATTGQILMFLSLLYPVWPRKFKINPYFEESVINGNVLIKGKIYIIVVVWAGVRIYFDKKFKRLMRIYNKHTKKTA